MTITELERSRVPVDEPFSDDSPAPVSRWLAMLRIATGCVFLWSFLDKLFGLGFATAADSGWVEGGAPTEGFLRVVAVGPLQDTLNGWAGAAWADWLFMAGMAGIGSAVLLGVALRFAALSGTTMMAMLWIASWPPARYDAMGEATHSTNPVVDSHVVYALALIVLAVTRAGDRWGLGRVWARLPVIRSAGWLQ